MAKRNLLTADEQQALLYRYAQFRHDSDDPNWIYDEFVHWAIAAGWRPEKGKVES